MALLDQPVCVVDVETWNPGGGRHRLLEIAALVVDVDGAPALGLLDSAGRSAGRGAPLMYQSLCRPEGYPPGGRGVRLHNAIDPRWIAAPGVRPEAEVARDFAEWHFSVALNAPLVAYNSSFDKAALAGALALTNSPGLRWARCLMLAACEHLQLTRKKDGKIRRKAPKEEVAKALFDPEVRIRELAQAIGWSGPLTMHLGLPDVLLEVGILVAIKRGAEARRRASPRPPRSRSLLGDT